MLLYFIIIRLYIFVFKGETEGVNLDGMEVGEELGRIGEGKP